MKCKSCRKDIEKKEHTYCPYCGTQLKRKPFYKLGMKDVTDMMFQNLEKRLMKKLFTLLAETMKDGNPQTMGPFKVKVITKNIQRETDEPREPPQRRTRDPTTTLKKRPIPKETIEPQADYIKLPNMLRIEVELPGVGSIEDIDIIKLENSCEIRAYKEDALYHKIIEIPENLKLTRKNLENDILLLEFKGK